jgi:uncharacterized DUF497 family protein
MDYEWFEAKRLRTLQERGLDFRDAARLLDGRQLFTYVSARNQEIRFVTVGPLGDHLMAVVWTERGAARRIISMRRARRGEERAYRALLG